MSSSSPVHRLSSSPTAFIASFLKSGASVTSQTARYKISAVRGIAGIAALWMTLTEGTLPAQERPTFRSTTALVTVDAVILDTDGNFATGLRAGDLELFEDGKPQKIQQFYMVTHELARRTDVSAESAAAAEHVEHRVFVMLFDEAHLANDSLMRVKRGAERFISELMGPGDVGGVFLNGGMYKGRLTSSKAELIEAVHAVKPAFDNRQALLAPFREFPRIPSEVDASRIADGARELVDEIGVKACNEFPRECQLAGGVQQVENLIQQKARLYVRQARMLTTRTIQNLQTVARGLSRFPGRKTVVFMSEGFFVEESRGTLEKVAGQLARSGTAIYSVDGRGLVNGSSPNPDVLSTARARATTFDTGEDGPTILTANTGGFMVRNTDDMSRAFGMIVRDTSTYYVIGYQPENSAMDGKFRKIELKSHVAGLKIRARKGYAAVTLPPQDITWK
jgi:VWFA-related protein